MTRISPCNKHRFRTAAAARRALHKARRSRSSRRKEKRYYQCDLCGAFHLTSKPE